MGWWGQPSPGKGSWWARGAVEVAVLYTGPKQLFFPHSLRFACPSGPILPPHFRDALRMLEMSSKTQPFQRWVPRLEATDVLERQGLLSAKSHSLLQFLEAKWLHGFS